MKNNLTNRECCRYAANFLEFTNKNKTIFGYSNYKNLHPITYTVYSYGQHFPMYVYDFEKKKWYGNKDRYSMTTSKHQSMMRPSIVEEYYDTNTLGGLSQYGYEEFILRVLTNS